MADFREILLAGGDVKQLPLTMALLDDHYPSIRETLAEFFREATAWKVLEFGDVHQARQALTEKTPPHVFLTYPHVHHGGGRSDPVSVLARELRAASRIGQPLVIGTYFSSQSSQADLASEEEAYDFCISEMPFDPKYLIWVIEQSLVDTILGPAPRGPRRVLNPSLMGRNVFTQLPWSHSRELVTILAQSQSVRVEHIISRGQVSPPDFWYDQKEHELVILLRGRAKLMFDREWSPEETLERGDWVLIPPHQRHRVTYTTPDEDTIWLAVFYE